MISFGIDPSLTAFGVAILNTEAIGLSRRVHSEHIGTPASVVPTARYSHYRSLVKKILSSYQPSVVGVESPVLDSSSFSYVHYTLMMYALEAIFDARIDCVLFDPSTLKYLTRGNKSKRGLMTKLDMQRFVQLDTMDSNIIDDNEADAYCLAYFAARFADLFNGKIKPEDLNENEFHTFLGKTKKVKTLKGTKIKKTAHIFRENNRFFQFSKISRGMIDLPDKSDINQSIIEFMNNI